MVSAARYNLARFDLVSIRLAVTCARTGSLTAAAGEAHLALAAASRRIRDLEAALGEPLFERHPRGLSATAAGRVFARHGMDLLQTMDRLGGELADLRQGIARHIRLAASTAAINQFLPPLLASWNASNPGIQIDVEEQVSEGVVGALRDGRAEIGVFVEGPGTAGLDVLPFRRDELVLVLPAGHRLAESNEPIEFSELLAEDWISLSAGAAMLLAQQQAALAAGRPLKVRMQLGSFDAVCHMVAARLGVALLPEGAVQPLLRSMKLVSRALVDAWARRALLAAVAVGQGDAEVLALRTHLIEPSQNAKPKSRKRQ